MSRDHHYDITVRWTGNTGEGTARYRSYERAHEVTADGKPPLHASADPFFAGTPSGGTRRTCSSRRSPSATCCPTSRCAR